jgi:hypothetical protein
LGQNSQNSVLSSTQPAPLEAVDSPVFGGSVIGVASKIKRPSVIVYQGGKTYFEWEFIWNPLMAGAAGAPGQQIPGLTAPAQPGAAPNPTTLPGANSTNNTPGVSPGTPQSGNPFAPGAQPMPQGAPQPTLPPGPQN